MRNNTTFSSRPSASSRRAHQQARQMFAEYDTSGIMPKKSKLPLVFGALVGVLVILGIVALALHFFG